MLCLARAKKFNRGGNTTPSSAAYQKVSNSEHSDFTSVRRDQQALEHHHRVVENFKFMRAVYFPNANSDIADETVLSSMLCYVKSLYYHHFIGTACYRQEYKSAVSMLEQLEEKAVPLSRKDSSGFSDEVRRILAYARDNRLE
jgi:hypothetical protein